MDLSAAFPHRDIDKLAMNVLVVDAGQYLEDSYL